MIAGSLHHDMRDTGHRAARDDIEAHGLDHAVKVAQCMTPHYEKRCSDACCGYEFGYIGAVLEAEK